MSIIAPNGQVRLLSRVPIDDSYDNTIYFENVSAQTSYFLGLTPVHQMVGATRVRDGVISVNALEDNIRHANYIMFQNQAFGNKWFYGFITGTRYVNNEMTHVSYKIDEIQTWLISQEVELEQCFVEREHTETDGMFEHLIDEGLEVSEYVNNNTNEETTSSFYELKGEDACLFTASIPSTSEPFHIDAPFEATFGNMNGLSVVRRSVRNTDGTWDTEGINALEEVVHNLVDAQQSDAIVGCVLFPKNFIDRSAEHGQEPITPDTLQIIKYTSSSKINGYTPKNKKLYNSPYCVYMLGSADGQMIPLQPEYLGSNGEVEIRANISMNPSILAVPKHYKNKATSWDDALSINSFPQMAMALDGYKAWVATGALDRLNLNTAVEGARSVVKLVQGINTVGAGASLESAAKRFGTEDLIAQGQRQKAEGIGQVFDAGLDIVSEIGNAMITMGVAKSLPPTIKGNFNTEILSTYNISHIFVKQMCVNKDVAESIDNYLTMFGYKVNKVKKPIIKNRPKFTYIKTRGCKANGGAPSTSITTIQRIFDRGIRFWVNASEVGDYTVNNAPV